MVLDMITCTYMHLDHPRGSLSAVCHASSTLPYVLSSFMHSHALLRFNVTMYSTVEILSMTTALVVTETTWQAASSGVNFTCCLLSYIGLYLLTITMYSTTDFVSTTDAREATENAVN